MIYLRQGTAKVVNFGIVFDTSLTNYTGTIAYGDAKIYKNGSEGALNGSATFTHKSNGRYLLSLTASDTDTLGPLEVGLNVAGQYSITPFRAMVLPAKVYDSIVAGSDNLEVDTIQWLGTAPKTPTTAGVPKIDLDAIFGTTLTETVGGYLAGRFKDLLDSATNPYQRMARAILGRPSLYVAKSGSDSNDGITPTTAFLTIDKAVDTLVALGVDGYGYLINVGPSGTAYAEGVDLSSLYNVILRVNRGASITGGVNHGPGTVLEGGGTISNSLTGNSWDDLVVQHGITANYARTSGMILVGHNGDNECISGNDATNVVVEDNICVSTGSNGMQPNGCKNWIIRRNQVYLTAAASPANRVDQYGIHMSNGSTGLLQDNLVSVASGAKIGRGIVAHSQVNGGCDIGILGGKVLATGAAGSADIGFMKDSAGNAASRIRQRGLVFDTVTGLDGTDHEFGPYDPIVDENGNVRAVDSSGNRIARPAIMVQ